VTPLLTVPARHAQAPTQAPTSPCRPFFTASDATGLDSSLRLITAHRCNSTLRLMRGGAYRLQREHSIASSVVITGAGAGGEVVFRPYAFNYRHFNVTGTTGNLTLISMTLADAYQDGSGIIYGGSIYLASGARGRFISVTFRNNTVRVRRNAALTNVEAYGQGGALWSNADSVAFDGCVFVSNMVWSQRYADGGAAYLSFRSYSDGVTITNTTFVNNTLETRLVALGAGVSRGGALYVDGGIGMGTSVVIDGGRFLGNQAIGRFLTTGHVWGGAVYLSIPTAVLKGVVFTRNVAYGASSSRLFSVNVYGGAISLVKPVGLSLRLSLRSVAFHNNSAMVPWSWMPALRTARGGGVYMDGCCSVLIWNDTEFVGNVASSPRRAYGGGAMLWGPVGTLALDAVTFRENYASVNGSMGTNAFGGGLMVWSAPTTSLTFSNCSWTSNRAALNNTADGRVSVGGGALYGRGGTVVFDRCSFLTNQAVGAAMSASTAIAASGGALALSVMNASLNHSTVVANSVVTAGPSASSSCATGGGAWVNMSTLSVVGGTVFRANTANAMGTVTCNQGGAIYVLGASAAVKILSGTVVEYSGSRAANTAYNDVVVSETTAVVQPTSAPSAAPSPSPTQLPSFTPTQVWCR
jgi:hypothetical protein